MLALSHSLSLFSARLLIFIPLLHPSALRSAFFDPPRALPSDSCCPCVTHSRVLGWGGVARSHVLLERSNMLFGSHLGLINHFSRYYCCCVVLSLARSKHLLARILIPARLHFCPIQYSIAIPLSSSILWACVSPGLEV